MPILCAENVSGTAPTPILQLSRFFRFSFRANGTGISGPTGKTHIFLLVFIFFYSVLVFFYGPLSFFHVLFFPSLDPSLVEKTPLVLSSCCLPSLIYFHTCKWMIHLFTVPFIRCFSSLLTPLSQYPSPRHRVTHPSLPPPLLPWSTPSSF